MKPRAVLAGYRSLLTGSLLLAACLLSGCVAFEHVPDTLECDPMLAGRWVPLSETDRPGSENVVVAQDCRTVFPPPNRGSRESYRMTLRSFALDEWRYMVFSPHDAERIYGLEAGTLASLGEASLLLRYRIDGDVLQGWIVDSDAALKAATSDQINLRTVERDHYLVIADEQATTRILRNQPALFDNPSGTPAVQLHRVSETSP